MTKNLGNIDRIFRVLLFIAAAYFYFTDMITGTTGLILLLIGAVFLGTALVSTCPIYLLIGARTCKVDSSK